MAAEAIPCHDSFPSGPVAMSTKWINVNYRILGSPVPVFLMMGLMISLGLTLPRKIPCQLLTSIGYKIPCQAAPNKLPLKQQVYQLVKSSLPPWSSRTRS
jgi:hypothetical protein